MGMTFDRCIGFVFDQNVVESELGKCSYAWDGATNNRYNGGCGMGAPGNDCSKNGNAFQNICPSTGKICTADDNEVKDNLCEPAGPAAIPGTVTDYQCMWEGPALNYPWTKGSSNLRDMVNARLEHQNGTDSAGRPKIEEHNEVVLDDRVLMPAIARDPAGVISAFVYVKDCGNGRVLATTMRDRFCQSRGIPVDTIPVVGIDTGVDFTTTGGPFFAEGGEEGEEELAHPGRGNLRGSQR